MEQSQNSQLLNALEVNKGSIRLHFLNFVRKTKPTEIVSVLLALCALVLWAISLAYVNIRDITDLGLVSVLPASAIIALVILTISFCLTLQQPELRLSILL